MSIDGNRYRHEPQDLVQKVIDLERRLSRLEHNPRIGNTTIDTGTLRVRDANGIVQVELGLLSDGTYGLNILDNNEFHPVPYSYVDFVYPSGETTNSTTYTDLATIGPRVTVPVGSSGRIHIIATAQIQWIIGDAASNKNGGRFDVEFSGANTRSPNEVIDPLVGAFSIQDIVSTGTYSGSAIGSMTAQATFSGLNPGNTTITMKYRWISDSTGTLVDFHRRGMAVVKL